MKKLYGVWAKFTGGRGKGYGRVQRHTWCIPKKQADSMARRFRKRDTASLGISTMNVSVRTCSVKELKKDLRTARKNPTMPKPAHWQRMAKNPMGIV